MLAIGLALAVVGASSAVLAKRLGVAPVSPARLAWFYGSPTDGTSAHALARSHEAVILTLGDERFREQLREAEYEGPVLQYVTLAKAAGPAGAQPGSNCDPAFRPWRNQAAWLPGDFCARLHANEGWFLHNGRGERLYVEARNGWFYAMDPGSEGWRGFFRHRVRQALAGDGERGPYGYDGIFLDEVWGTLHPLERGMRNSDGIVSEYGHDSDWEAAVRTFVDSVRSDARELGFPVWGNPAPQSQLGRFRAHLDGIMIENFAASWDGDRMSEETVERVWDQVEADVAAGKSIVLVGQGAQEDHRRARYAFAAYLMAAREDVTFRYHDAADYRTLWRYPEFETPLGEPAGDRYRLAGSVWARRLENGVALVNLSGAEQRVALPGTFALGDGTLAEAVTMAPTSGLVLTE